LPLAGITVATTLTPAALLAPDPVFADAQALIMPADRTLLSANLLATCDRAGIRILLLGASDIGGRLARRHGLGAPLPTDSTAWDIADALADDTRGAAATPPERGSIITIWGAPGAPGRTTLAIQ